MKKKHIQNILIIAIIVAIISTFAYFKIDIQSVGVHKKLNNSEKTIGEVTLSINCDTINDNYDKLDNKLKDEKYVPSDGDILKEEKYTIHNGDTVFDILVNATKINDIQMEYSGSDSKGTQYIRGINYLYEFSCGKLSGWMYKVNDEFPGHGCGQYKLKDGDKIEFVYTCDLGRDVGDTYDVNRNGD